nr:sigma-70 family RNA polymerase sigma factor [Lysinibacillus timonensis]
MKHIIRLVKKAQMGDDHAFLMIFQQYQDDLYRMAYVYMKNQEDALDILQEVAYQSFKKINTLKNPKYIKTWLLKITINCAINTINKRKKVVPLNTHYEEFIGWESNETIPLSIALQEVIELLKEEEKSVVLLRFYQNYTLKEISEALEIPLGTAKSILYRALNKLRNELKEVDLRE